MSEQDVPADSDATEQTEPTQGSEQSKADSYGNALLALAREEGHTIGLEPPVEEPKAEAEPEEPKDEEEVTETVTEPKEDESSEALAKEEPEEELQPAAKKDEWPESAKARVAEEKAKRQRANERAEKAETLAAQLQAQLQKAVLPQPTEDNPFIDVQDVDSLKRLKKSYEDAIDLADDNPDGAVDVTVGRDNAGNPVKRDFSVEELSVIRRKADKAIRTLIPEREQYLAQRDQESAMAVQKYPQLLDPEAEFAKQASVLAQNILTGQAQRSPDLLIWVARAIRGYQAEQAENGKTPVPPSAKKIIASAQQKIAPQTVRSRSIPERGTGSTDLRKANQEMEEKGDFDAGVKLVGAIFSKRGTQGRVNRVAE